MARHWFPAEPLTESTLGAAIWMERRYWNHMAEAVATGIAKAFNGRG